MTAGSSSSRNRSYAERCTRIRERAQQSCPALSKTAYGARRRGLLEVGVGEDDVGALAAELQRHPLHLVGAAGHDPLADLGRAGEARSCGRPGARRTAAPTTEPLPGSTVNTSSGSPASSASSPSRIAVSGVSSAGFSTTVLPAASAGAKRPAGDRHREVPRHDHADDAERLVEGDVEAAGHRDLPAEQPLRRRAVVGQHVADVARLPAGVADGVPGVAHLELGQLLEVRVDDVGEPAQQPPAVGRGDLPPGVEGAPGPRDRGVGVRDVRQGNGR